MVLLFINPLFLHPLSSVGALGATYKSPQMGATYKSPQLHTPSPRSHPYHVPSQEDQDVNLLDEGELSGISDVSPWSLSDDVKRILQKDASREVRLGLKNNRVFDGHNITKF